jgi:hypothetical protein
MPRWERLPHVRNSIESARRLRSRAVRQTDRVWENIGGLAIIPLTVDEIVSEERRIRL